MDSFIISLGVAVLLAGVYGAWQAITSTPVPRNALTRFLFGAQLDREPTRAFVALSSGALITLGAYFLLAGIRPGLPLWPSLIPILTFAALQIAAHLQRQDV